MLVPLQLKISVFSPVSFNLISICLIKVQHTYKNNFWIYCEWKCSIHFGFLFSFGRSYRCFPPVSFAANICTRFYLCSCFPFHQLRVVTCIHAALCSPTLSFNLFRRNEKLLFSGTAMNNTKHSHSICRWNKNAFGFAAIHIWTRKHSQSPSLSLCRETEKLPNNNSSTVSFTYTPTHVLSNVHKSTQFFKAIWF